MLQISGSVGRGGTNLAADVVNVSTHLVSLGYSWVHRAMETGKVDADLVFAIKLFQSIVRGSDVISREADGRIDPYGKTLTWLNAKNAPRWRLMPVTGDGLRNDEAADRVDQHDWGTSWFADTILGASCSYLSDYMLSHPGAPPIVLNDVSLPTGGDTKDHTGHETGLGGDTKLPRLDGAAGGITWKDALYDRPAMLAQLRAWREQPLIDLIYFNDPEAIKLGLCYPSSGHDNHVHSEIKPPSLLV